MINGGNPCGVFWQIGSSATLGTSHAFVGNILALTSITLTTGANITGGRALARNGAVTLDTNNINVCDVRRAPCRRCRRGRYLRAGGTCFSRWRAWRRSAGGRV